MEKSGMIEIKQIENGFMCNKVDMRMGIMTSYFCKTVKDVQKLIGEKLETIEERDAKRNQTQNPK